MSFAQCESCCARTPVPLGSAFWGALRLLILVSGITITSHQLICRIISGNLSPCAFPWFWSAYLSCGVALVLFIQYKNHSCTVLSISPMICSSNARASAARFSTRLPLHLHQPVIRNLRICLLIDCLLCHRLWKYPSATWASVASPVVGNPITRRICCE